MLIFVKDSEFNDHFSCNVRPFVVIAFQKHVKTDIFYRLLVGRVRRNRQTIICRVRSFNNTNSKRRKQNTQRLVNDTDTI